MFKKEFKVYSPLTSESVKSFTKDGSDDERILLEGIASTTSRDLQDEVVALTAIESMSEQAPLLNIHGDHYWSLEGVLGAIKEATVEDKQLHIKFLITKEYTPKVRDLLETGVRLGLSIGGYATNYDEKNHIINEIELHEISLTAMPANWDTMGTVTTGKGLVKSNCVAGACYEIIKELGGNPMTKEDHIKAEANEDGESNEATGLTQDDVIELINEYMAEKEETIAQEITEKVESQIETIVESKVQELLDAQGEEDDNKAAEPEDEEDDETNEEDEDSTKNFKPEMITEAVEAALNKALGDDFAEKVASTMFGDLDKSRNTKGSKYEQYIKNMPQEQDEDKKETKTFTSKDAAQVLLGKQKVNPIIDAAMKNL